jgi:hypothetical protein
MYFLASRGYRCIAHDRRGHGRQSALAWEPRTATSLAHLWSKQGRIDEARGILAPVCDRFTEGLGSPDFGAAKHLLNELSGRSPVVYFDQASGRLPGDFVSARTIRCFQR